jgi:hypothetical protein
MKAEATDYSRSRGDPTNAMSDLFAPLVFCRERMSISAPSKDDALAALVQRLLTADDTSNARVSATPDDSSNIEEVMRIGADVRVVRQRDELYIALVVVGDDVAAYRLGVGLGRLVWTLATAARTTDRESARRVLVEAGIVELARAVPSAKCQVQSGVDSEKQEVGGQSSAGARPRS